MCKSF